MLKKELYRAFIGLNLGENQQKMHQNSIKQPICPMPPFSLLLRQICAYNLNTLNPIITHKKPSYYKTYVTLGFECSFA